MRFLALALALVLGACANGSDVASVRSDQNYFVGLPRFASAPPSVSLSDFIQETKNGSKSAIFCKYHSSTNKAMAIGIYLDAEDVRNTAKAVLFTMAYSDSGLLPQGAMGPFSSIMNSDPLTSFGFGRSNNLEYTINVYWDQGNIKSVSVSPVSGANSLADATACQFSLTK